MPFLVYIIALAIAAGTLALSVDLATRPDIEPVKQQVASSAPVRQIPITKPSDVSRGDPHNQLSPVYPASPGKDLPTPADVADTKTDNMTSANNTPNNPPSNNQPNVASTTGSAPPDDADEPRAQLASTGAAAAPAPSPNSCAVSACSSAYRSFRASDCTYQPFGGPRKLCELNEGAAQNGDATAQPVALQRRDAAPRSRMLSRGTDLDAAARVVRQLPADDIGGNAGRRVIVIERPGLRYEPGVVYEEW